MPGSLLLTAFTKNKTENRIYWEASKQADYSWSQRIFSHASVLFLFFNLPQQDRTANFINVTF